MRKDVIIKLNCHELAGEFKWVEYSWCVDTELTDEQICDAVRSFLVSGTDFMAPVLEIDGEMYDQFDPISERRTAVALTEYFSNHHSPKYASYGVLMGDWPTCPCCSMPCRGTMSCDICGNSMCEGCVRTSKQDQTLCRSCGK